MKYGPIIFPEGSAYGTIIPGGIKYGPIFLPGGMAYGPLIYGPLIHPGG